MTVDADTARAAPAAATAPLLSVRNIEVVYDDVILVLRGLSLEVPQGAIVAVSGRGGVDVNLAATRVGGAIARYVSETARLNSWPAASR